MSFATDLAYLLERKGFGVVGTDIFVGVNLPDEPDSCIWIVDTGTADPPYGEYNYLYPIVQVTVRSSSNEFQKASDISYSVLQAINNFGGQLLTSHYSGILATTAPTNFGADDRDRPLFSVSFRAIVKFNVYATIRTDSFSIVRSATDGIAVRPYIFANAFNITSVSSKLVTRISVHSNSVPLVRNKTTATNKTNIKDCNSYNIIRVNTSIAKLVYAVSTQINRSLSDITKLKTLTSDVININRGDASDFFIRMSCKSDARSIVSSNTKATAREVISNSNSRQLCFFTTSFGIKQFIVSISYSITQAIRRKIISSTSMSIVRNNSQLTKRKILQSINYSIVSSCTTNILRRRSFLSDTFSIVRNSSELHTKYGIIDSRTINIIIGSNTSRRAYWVRNATSVSFVRPRTIWSTLAMYAQDVSITYKVEGPDPEIGYLVDDKLSDAWIKKYIKNAVSCSINHVSSNAKSAYSRIWSYQIVRGGPANMIVAVANYACSIVAAKTFDYQIALSVSINFTESNYSRKRFISPESFNISIATSKVNVKKTVEVSSSTQICFVKTVAGDDPLPVFLTSDIVTIVRNTTQAKKNRPVVANSISISRNMTEATWLDMDPYGVNHNEDWYQVSKPAAVIDQYYYATKNPHTPTKRIIKNALVCSIVIANTDVNSYIVMPPSNSFNIVIADTAENFRRDASSNSRSIVIAKSAINIRTNLSNVLGISIGYNITDDSSVSYNRYWYAISYDSGDVNAYEAYEEGLDNYLYANKDTLINPYEANAYNIVFTVTIGTKRKIVVDATARQLIHARGNCWIRVGVTNFSFPISRATTQCIVKRNGASNIRTIIRNDSTRYARKSFNSDSRSIIITILEHTYFILRIDEVDRILKVNGFQDNIFVNKKHI